MFCGHAIVTNTNTSHCSGCIHIPVCVWISSPENIGPVCKTCRFISGDGERGFKRNDAFSLFANIDNYGRPLR